MTDEYIRKQDAVKASLEFTVEYLGGAFNEWLQKELKTNLESIEPADVVPYSVSPDGTLIITVPKGTTANRVLVEWEGTHCGGLYYAD